MAEKFDFENETPLDRLTQATPYIKVHEPLLVQVLEFGAVVPTRAHESDTGLDVTPIALRKQLRNDTWLLGTGLAVKPPTGLYIDMVGRSSISKTDVMISNAFGVIDEQYRGELMIAVTLKPGTDPSTFDPTALITGKPLAQLVLRPLLVADVQVTDELDATERGAGGFGHTDTKRV